MDLWKRGKTHQAGRDMHEIYRTESNYERNREKLFHTVGRGGIVRLAVSIISNVYPSRTSPYWSLIIIEGSGTLLTMFLSHL